MYSSMYSSPSGFIARSSERKSVSELSNVVQRLVEEDDVVGVPGKGGAVEIGGEVVDPPGVALLLRRAAGDAQRVRRAVEGIDRFHTP